MPTPAGEHLTPENIYGGAERDAAFGEILRRVVEKMNRMIYGVPVCAG